MTDPGTDRRDIRNGLEIPTESYSDQPYIVRTNDGAWLCAVTTGAGHEGEGGQHVVTMRSTDRGRTWSPPVDVEPTTGPEASYAVLLAVPESYPNAGRIYVFYNHNTDNVREVIADRDTYPDGFCRRVDSLGHYVFKVSDDSGRTWSHERYDIPMRTMAIDRANPYGGKLKFFWNVGKPCVHEGAAYCSLHKVGGFGAGFFTSSEGVLLKSTDLFTERDPARVTWETLPDGDLGLRTPPGGGPVAEEHSYVVLSDGSFYATYRTIDGYPVEAYSRDGGHTWSAPRYRAYADGRPMKHPRAATFVWRLENGRYLTWFHNHGGRSIAEHPRRRSIAYEERNPVWLCAGTEVDGPEGKELRWSQPEIVLYDDDPFIRISYPDLVEEDGRVFLTETQKDKARVHEIDPALLTALWRQEDRAEVVRDGLILELPTHEAASPPREIRMPALPPFLERDTNRADYGTRDLRRGFTLDLGLRLPTLAAGQMLLDNRSPSGKGFGLRLTERGALEIVLNDGRTESRWASDPDALKAGAEHQVTVMVDGGPKIITFVVDGRLHDGGEARQFGWGRFNPHLRDVNGGPVLRIDPHVVSLRIYDRALLTSGAISNSRATRRLAKRSSRHR